MLGLIHLAQAHTTVMPVRLDLVCGFGRVVRGPGFGVCLGVVGRCGRVGCTMGVEQQSVCLVVGLVAVGGCDFLFTCTMVGQASDLRTALT